MVKLHYSVPNGISPWSTDKIHYCGGQPSGGLAPRNFQAYQYWAGQLVGYYYFSWYLKRDGQDVAKFIDDPYDLRGTNMAQNATFQRTFFSVVPEIGQYTVRLLVQRRTWSFNRVTELDITSDAIEVGLVPPVHSFNVLSASGTYVPPNSDGSPIKVSLSTGVMLDATMSTCLPGYMLMVQESNASWNRTMLHEWGKWFEGAPGGPLNLQQLTSQYSTSDGNGYFSLLGGTFAAGPFPGQKRYYRIGLQAKAAAWNPLFALIEVDW